MKGMSRGRESGRKRMIRNTKESRDRKFLRGRYENDKAEIGLHEGEVNRECCTIRDVK